MQMFLLQYKFSEGGVLPDEHMIFNRLYICPMDMLQINKLDEGALRSTGN